MNEKTLSIVVKAQDKASQVMEGIGDKVHNVGAKIAAAMKVATAATLAAGAAFGVDAVKNAINLGESINAVEKTFGDASDKIFEFGRVAAQQAGLSKAAFNSAVVPIGAMLQNMGYNADQASESSINLAKRAADLASVFNTSLDDALTAIQAGLRGEADPLERFGVGLSQTAVKAYAVANGLVKEGEEMDKTTAATARLGLFMNQTNRFAGDFVDTADEAANKSRILKAEFENQSVAIGKLLLPVYEKLLSVSGVLVRDIIPVLGSGIAYLSQRFGEMLPTIVAVANQVGDYLGPKIMALWATVNNNLIPVLSRLWHEVLAPLAPVIGTVLVGALGLAIDAANVMIQAFSGIINGILNGNPILWGLIGTLGVLGGALALSAGLAAFQGAMATMTASFVAFRGLVAIPLIMPALAVGAALASIALVLNKYQEMKATIEETNRAIASNNASIEASLRQANEQYKSGKISKDRYNAILNNAYRAEGGPVEAGQPYIVGEREAELFVPNQSGTILNQDQMREAGIGGSTFNMYGSINLGSAGAVDRFFERLNAQKEMGGLGVGI